MLPPMLSSEKPIFSAPCMSLLVSSRTIILVSLLNPFHISTVSLFTKPLHLDHLPAMNLEGTLVDTLGNPDAGEAFCGRGSLEGTWSLLSH